MEGGGSFVPNVPLPYLRSIRKKRSEHPKVGVSIRARLNKEKKSKEKNEKGKTLSFFDKKSMFFPNDIQKYVSRNLKMVDLPS